MLRNIWIAVCGTLCSGGLVLGQPGPPNPPPSLYGNPGAYRYPGYPTPSYGPPMPMGPMGPGGGLPMGQGVGAGPPMMPMGPGEMMPNTPYGNAGPMGPGGMMPNLPYGNAGPMGPGGMMPNTPYGNAGPMGPGGMMPNLPYGNAGPMGPGGMMPNTPYGNAGPMGPGGMMPNLPYGNPLPMPIPPDPRRPVGMPTFDGGGPKQGAAEPYMVGPEKKPVAAPAMPPPTAAFPTAPPMAAMADPSFVPATCGVPGPPLPPAEPYTLYEGPRYLSEVKQDNVCVFGQVGYTHWWVRHDQTPPLLTTGNPNSVNPGSLANSDTRVLLGGGIDPTEFSGVQASIGFWLDPERLTSIEIGGFYLGKNTRNYSFASDANGNNIISQPIIASTNGGPYAENALPIAVPGIYAGGASFSSSMNLLGAELNFCRNVFRLNGWSLDWLAGFRYLYLNDTLTMSQNYTGINGFQATFLGVTEPVGTTFLLNDSFNLTNRFYGGQIGGRLDWVSCSGIDFGAMIKVALGDTVHTAIIDGSTTINNAGAISSVPGGAYSQASSIGTHQSGDFSAVTDLQLTIGYQIHPNIRLFAGYDLLYWPRVERAGEQIDRTIDLAQVPSFQAVPGGTGQYPRFLNAKTDFWAQGINVGVEVKY